MLIIISGETDKNARGDMIRKIILNSGLTVMNSGEPTHYHIQTDSLTVVDLSICSPEILMDFDWDVEDDLRGSDHYPIALQAVSPMPQSCNPKWNTDKADWTLFTKSCTFEIEVHEHDTVDKAVEYFSRRIQLAASMSIPRTSGSFHRRPVPWWNSDCSRARLESRRAESRLKSRPASQALKIEFLRTRASYRRTMKEARRESWRS